MTALDQYPELTVQLLALNHITNLSAEFDSSLRGQLAAELVTAAAKDAAKQAERMAQSLGNKIHSVYEMSQLSDLVNFFSTFGAADMSCRAGAMISDGAQVQMKMFIPQTIEIQQGINVVFRLTTEK